MNQQSEHPDQSLPEECDIRPEYDLAEAVRLPFGRRHELLARRVILAPDLAGEFADSEAVNVALREYLRMKKAG